MFHLDFDDVGTFLFRYNDLVQARGTNHPERNVHVHETSRTPLKGRPEIVHTA